MFFFYWMVLVLCARWPTTHRWYHVRDGQLSLAPNGNWNVHVENNREKTKKTKKEPKLILISIVFLFQDSYSTYSGLRNLFGKGFLAVEVYLKKLCQAITIQGCRHMNINNFYIHGVSQGEADKKRLKFWLDQIRLDINIKNKIRFCLMSTCIFSIRIMIPIKLIQDQKDLFGLGFVTIQVTLRASIQYII